MRLNLNYCYGKVTFHNALEIAYSFQLGGFGLYHTSNIYEPITFECAME